MIPTFPEIRVQLLPLLVLLVCVAALGTRVELPRRAHTAAGPGERAVFDPFTDHSGLPAGLTWLVQIESPATQIESEQGRSLAAAISQTELMAQTGKAWTRLARSLGGEADAFELLGDRVQFIAGSLSVGQPWAVSLEINAEHRQRLLARLKAFPRLHRNKRPISELEDGRYLLAVFDRGEHALVLLGPRSDRTMSPEDDPETALFFEMFDRLSGAVTAGGGKPNTLAAPLEAVGAGEVLVARRVSSLSWNALDGSVSFEDVDSGAGPGQSDAGFVALRLDRAAGGWAGRLVVSDRDRAPDAARDAPSYERLANAVGTISCLSLSPGVRSVLPLLAAQAGPLPVWLPMEGEGPGWAALVRAEGGEKDARPSIAYVQRVEAVEGPERFDAAVADMLRSAQPGTSGPDHAGAYPGAVRAQSVETATWLGPRASVVWGYSAPSGLARTAAMVISPDNATSGPAAPGSDAAEATLRALLSADGAGEPGDAPVSAGRLRLAELLALYRAFVTPSQKPDPLLSRIESIGWSLRASEIGGVPAVIGPVSVTLTPSRQGGLGSK